MLNFIKLNIVIFKKSILNYKKDKNSKNLEEERYSYRGQMSRPGPRTHVMVVIVSDHHNHHIGPTTQKSPDICFINLSYT